MDQSNLEEVVTEEAVIEEVKQTETKKSKKKKVIIISAIVASLLIVAVAVAFIVLGGKKKEVEPPVVPTERYFEPANPTALQKEIYQQLITADHANDAETTRKLLAASFAVDFFTWSNKGSRQEVGGTIYFIENWKATFGTHAIQTYYRDFNELKNQFNQAGLPEVETYTVTSIEATDYVLEDPRIEGNYNVTIEFTYKIKENAMPTDTLPKSVVVTVGSFEDRFVVLAVNYTQASEE